MAPISLQLNPALSPSLSVRANENSSESQILNLPIKPQIQNSRVLILGGTGRVGGSTALALSKLSPNLRLVIGGRNREKGDDLVSRLGESSEFVQLDIENVRALESALQDPQWLSRDNIDVAHIGRDPQWQSGDDIDVPNIHRDPQWAVEHVSLTQSGIDGVEAFSLIGYISSRVACMWFKNLGNPTGRGSVIVADVDLVVHAAGPFQRAEKCTVLEAAISTKTAYMDVCDDADYSIQAKTFHEKAVAANIPAITTAGIYPGVSNVMAAELVRSAREENMGEPQKLRFSYFTAGTGGVGPTILATSFLLLGEDVVAYSKGEEVKLKPYSGKVNVDFGKGIGKKDVYLLNLPEVRSVHKILGVPTVSARFGTAPFFWNWGMLAMTLVPSEILRDRNKVQNLAELFDPVVRALDKYSGERVSMRVDLDCSNGRNTVGIFSHKKLSVSVGISTAAFALAILEGSTQPGVWFPEEPQGIAVEDRQLLLNRASQGTINFVMDQMPWMVESEPKELVFGIYL